MTLLKTKLSLRRLNQLFFVLLFLAAILLLAAAPAEVLRMQSTVQPEEVSELGGWIYVSLAVFGSLVVLAIVPVVLRAGRLFGTKKSLYYRFDYREREGAEGVHSGYLRELGEKEIVFLSKEPLPIGARIDVLMDAFLGRREDKVVKLQVTEVHKEVGSDIYFRINATLIKNDSQEYNIHKSELVRQF